MIDNLNKFAENFTFLKSYFFIITVVLITCRPLLPVIDYLVNYEKIVSELCVNRDRPELNCNGVCYLKDEVSKSSESQQKEKVPSTIKTIDFFVAESTLQISDSFIEQVSKINFPLKKEDIPQFQISELLHPPIV